VREKAQEGSTHKALVVFAGEGVAPHVKLNQIRGCTRSQSSKQRLPRTIALKNYQMDATMVSNAKNFSNGVMGRHLGAYAGDAVVGQVQ
jgi:hypothetical protein